MRDRSLQYITPAQTPSVVCDCVAVKFICHNAHHSKFLEFPGFLRLKSVPCVEWTVVNCFSSTSSLDKIFSTCPIASSRNIITTARNCARVASAPDATVDIELRGRACGGGSCNPVGLTLLANNDRVSLRLLKQRPGISIPYVLQRRRGWVRIRASIRE